MPDMLDEISKFVFTSKYARYLEDQQRRETWEEAVGRVESMHLNKFSTFSQELQNNIVWAFDLVRDKRTAPSMRSMQFGGKAVEAHNAKIYNCAVRHVDSLRSFSEIFYLLLCGCGVGIGLNDKFLGRLPDLVGPKDKTGTVLTYQIEDTIEGWADSIEALLSCYFKNTPFSGRKFVPDFSKIRAEGAILKTGGGKAPGYKGLKRSLNLIKDLLDRAIETNGQQRLLSIDAYDINMHMADAVLSGGVRRSATAVIFDKDDEAMLNAKTGDWFNENPQRGRSNNSVRVIRSEIDRDEFKSIVERTREWGEPGFVFADHSDILFNPCFEISFIPVTDDGVCGVQFCNLTTVNGAKVKTPEDFYNAIRAAAIIGTLQAAYTEFPYLSNAARKLTEEEALLGVSITGMMDNPKVLLDPEVQREAARIAVETNEYIARLIGINPAARVTAIKPEGTSSLAFGTMRSGIHAAHAPVMIRRIQMNTNDNVYKFFSAYNSHLCEPSVWSANKTDDVVSFPVTLPEGGYFKGDLNAIEHLDIIKSTQENYVIAGQGNNFKEIQNNVSCTVSVDIDEWEKVEEYLFDNRDYFAAVSLIRKSGDKDYAQAPNEAMTTEEELAKHKKMIDYFIPMDYTLMVESQDQTTLMNEIACAGPEGCEIK